jgi:uncharacterized protein
MTSLIFPDVNVWLALAYVKHVHNKVATEWYETLAASTLFVFCRHTQLGLFRLLSTEAVMKQDATSQARCWEIYDLWVNAGLAIVAQDPAGLEVVMRKQTIHGLASPKVWADAYLAAFAEAGNLTLVTFDRALAAKAKEAVLLG